MVLNSWKRAVLSSHPRGLGTVFLHTGVRRVTQHLFIHGLFGSFLLRVFLHKLRQLSMDGLPKKGQKEWNVCVCVCGIVRLMKLLLTAAHRHIWAAWKWLNMTVLTEIEWKPNKSQRLKPHSHVFQHQLQYHRTQKQKWKHLVLMKRVFIWITHTRSFFSYMTSKSRPWSSILSIPEICSSFSLWRRYMRTQK